MRRVVYLSTSFCRSSAELRSWGEEVGFRRKTVVVEQAVWFDWGRVVGAVEGGKGDAAWLADGWEVKGSQK